MPEIKQQIELLVILQDKDIVLDKLKKQLSDNPLTIAELNQTLAQYKSETEESKNKLLDMLKLKKEKEIELQTREEEIKKHNMELNSIKSNEAYKALLIEIEGAKANKSVLEDEILDLMEKIDQESVAVKQRENDLKTKESEIQAKISKIEEDLKRIQAEIEKLQAEREEFAKQIPHDLLAKYNYIREGRDGIAVVRLEGEICGGCSTVLRPQTINDVYKSKDFVICDNCSRIIYKKNGT
jgi:predicted  nucleic acid-binding Zn-ribbon protein